MSILVADQNCFYEISGNLLSKCGDNITAVHCNCNCACANCGRCGCTGYCDIGNCRCRFKPETFKNISNTLNDFFAF